MAEDQKQDQQQDGSKTLVSFVVGLLIGGMLVWAFSGPSDNNHEGEDQTRDDEAGEVMDTDEDGDSLMDDIADGVDNTIDTAAAALPSLPVGDGSISVNNQAAGTQVALESATYPVSEGWIGVQDYNDEQFGALLGVVAFSESAGIVPDAITLQSPTTAGRQYAIVMYESNGVPGFQGGSDAKIDKVFATFTAQ